MERKTDTESSIERVADDAALSGEPPVQSSSRNLAGRRGLAWPDSLWFNLAVALIAGLLYALSLLGPHILNPHNIDWLRGDTATYFIGWALFRQDPHLHWPITFTDRIGYPIGDSIALMDVNPLLAVILKLVSPFLSDPFQYFGLEAALACGLQLFFAFRLFRLLLGPGILGVLLPGAFFLLAPPMTLRMSGHFALTNQWVLTASLYLFCLANVREAKTVTTRRITALSLVLAAVSVSINPYLAIQVLLVLATLFVALWWRKKLPAWQVLITCMLLGLTAVATAYAFGFIAHGDQSYQGGGYRSYSMNLFSPFDPNGYGSLFLPRLRLFVDDQYEGYCYLGAGAIVLMLVMLVFFGIKGRHTFKFRRSAAIPLLLCGLLLTLLALSSLVTAGSKVLVDLDPNQKLTPYLAILRSSGRLFWTSYYTLLLALLLSPYYFLTRRRANVLLALALAVQFADLQPLRHWLYGSINQSDSSPLKSPVWRRLGESYQNLMVMPPWQCGFTFSPGGRWGFATFGMLAATEHMRTNSYYSARPIDHGYHCEASVAAIGRQPLPRDAAYVLTPSLASKITANRAGKCKDVDGFILCSSHDDPNLDFSPPWKSAAQVWIQDRFHCVLKRNPTEAEQARWNSDLGQDRQLTASFFYTLLNSAEFQKRRLPELILYRDRYGAWPTPAAWLNYNPRLNDRESARELNMHSAADRDRAVVAAMYFAILQRDPDLPGLATWSRVLRETSLQAVIVKLLTSSEYLSRTDLHYPWDR
jgi:Family of unknown function (DUF6311)